MRLVALESGTTSTRAWIVEDGRLLGGEQAHVGARDIARGQTRDWLAAQFQALIDTALREHDVAPSEVDAVVGYGMLTSELGLEEVAHLHAPVGAEDLASALHHHTAGPLGRDGGPVSALPLYLIPGVICGNDGASGLRDFMRGEETEVIGLVSEAPRALPLLFVSPGSHTKFVTVDREARIAGSHTTLTGELVWALHRETILAELIDPSRDDVDLGQALEGADAAARHGLSRALYSTRLRSRLDGLSSGLCSDFAIGAIAGTDVAALPASGSLPGTVVVHGDSGLALVYEALLRREAWADEVQRVSAPIGPMGAWRVYQRAVEMSAAGTVDLGR